MTYNESTWTETLQQAGFAVRDREIHLKRHDFAAWTSATCIKNCDRSAVERLFLEADDSFLKRYRVEVEDGRVIAFTDEKLILGCVVNKHSA